MATSWSMPVGSGDRWPEDYERGRPGWPLEAVAVAGVPASATVLDLGAGTGKLTRVLTDAFAGVIAVEPAEAMRRLLVRQCPEAEALAGTAEEIPLGDGSVDAVLAAQAYHRFGDERALAELVRVLRPGGALVLMWNLPGGPTKPSIAAVERLLGELWPAGLTYDPHDLGGPEPVLGTDWQRAFEGTPFEPLREATFPNPQTLDREGLVAFYASMGWIGDMPDEERLPLLERVRSHLTAEQYLRRWETHVYWTRRRAGAAAAHGSREG